MMEHLLDHISNRSEHFSIRNNNIESVREFFLDESHRSTMYTKSTTNRPPGERRSRIESRATKENLNI